MQTLIEQIGIAGTWTFIAIANYTRYLILAGTAWLVLYIIYRKKWKHRKIQAQLPKSSQLRRELGYSAITVSIFGCYGILVFVLRSHGLTLMYEEIDAYGWLYFWLSIPLMLVVHDTYFYWTHRLMHHPALYNVLHRVHHKSHNPSPFTAFAFHPLEGAIETSIVLVIVFIMPVHPIALLLFSIVSLAFNVLGHIGYELFPNHYLRTWWGKWNNTSTHHNMHHQYATSNFGLYFTIWDRLMGTNHPMYEKRFDEITKEKGKSNVFPIDTLRANI